MYTVEIGRQFLDLYNRKTGNDYMALEFFEKEFFPVVFDSEDQKQLYPFIHNSPFHQNSYPKLAEKEGIPVSEYRKQKFYEDLEQVPKGEKALSHSKLVGAKSGSVSDVPSGQVSNIDSNISKEEIIYSWIGGGLGIAFKGGYDVLLNDDQLNWFIFLGWKYYRKFLEQTDNAKGRQLPEWNACWICYGGDYKDNLERTFKEVVRGINKDNSRAKNIRIRKVEWTKMILGISRLFNKKQRVLAYAYKFQFGQNFNRTLGFFPIQFHDIDRWYELFETHLTRTSDLNFSSWSALQKVYQSYYRFEDACLQGGIGLKALKPKDLEKYVSRRSKSAKNPKMNTENQKINSLINKTWLIAMLDKQDIQDLSKELALALNKHSKSDDRGKTTSRRQVENLWDSTNLNQFVESLTEIMKNSNDKEIFTKVVDKIISDLPDDRFKLFLTLTKFNYYSHN